MSRPACPAGVDLPAGIDPPDSGKQGPDPAQLGPLGTALHPAATDGSRGDHASSQQAAAGGSAELQRGARSGGLAPDASAEPAQPASPPGYEEQAPQQPQPNAVVLVDRFSDTDDESGQEKVGALLSGQHCYPWQAINVPAATQAGCSVATSVKGLASILDSILQHNQVG